MMKQDHDEEKGNNSKEGNNNKTEQQLEVAVHQLKHNTIWLLCMNNYASLCVFFRHLITIESMISIILSVSLTITLYYTTDSERFNGQALNWILLSFAVVTPMASSISMAFNRRELALRGIATLRATLLDIYIAHAVWDWGDCGKTSGGKKASSMVMDPTEHSRQVYETVMQIQDNLCRYLTLPNSSRARHRTTRHGRREAIQIDAIATTFHERIMCAMVKLAQLCETLKCAGLPGNEAARIRQWEHFALSEVEQLRNIKRYRTPQGLRSFGRIFSVLAPPFYAPYYTALATELKSLGMGIAFSVLTAIALTSLFETVASLEDPFVEEYFLDGINVKEELVTLFEKTLSGRRRQLFGNEENSEKPVDS